jgi:transposase
MAKPGPKLVNRYSTEFKLKAVALSNEPGVLIKDVAESLCIHPFMLSRWRKEVRDGLIAGELPQPEPQVVAELKRLQEVERQFQRLQLEHDILKKAIRFASQTKAASSPSSKQTVKRSRSR